jgi:hypothetical protein
VRSTPEGKQADTGGEEIPGVEATLPVRRPRQRRSKLDRCSLLVPRSARAVRSRAAGSSMRALPHIARRRRRLASRSSWLALPSICVSPAQRAVESRASACAGAEESAIPTTSSWPLSKSAERSAGGASRSLSGWRSPPYPARPARYLPATFAGGHNRTAWLAASSRDSSRRARHGSKSRLPDIASAEMRGP